MNTSRAGSNMPCWRIHRRRARTTSPRLCSSAYRVFFEADVVSFVEPPHCGPTADDPGLRHRRDDFVQRQIGLLDDQIKQKFRVLLQRRDAAATWFGRNTSCLFPALRPNNHHAGADPVKFGRLAPRRACFDQFNHSYSQVVRIRLRHILPPESNHTADSLIDKPLGILLDSSRAENALGSTRVVRFCASAEKAGADESDDVATGTQDGEVCGCTEALGAQ